MTNMNISSVNDGDMFSSLEEELISNIKRPSLMSLTSEDSTDNRSVIPEEIFNYPELKNCNVRTSTPIKGSSFEDSLPKNTINRNESNFKVPNSNYPLSRDSKRYSLAVFTDPSSNYNLNKSNSMHDVSSFSSFCPLRRDSCMFSSETLQSNSIATSKSKDSGFQRSTSCTSLITSGSKKYDHVQSKVKQYIQGIKQTEALRKAQKRMKSSSFQSVENLNSESPETSPSSGSVAISKKDLLNKVKELEEELKEKDCVIEQLEKNHSELRLKYAAAENRIDDLRIRASQNDDPLNNYITDKKVAELLNNAKHSTSFSMNGIVKPAIKSIKKEESKISSSLGVSQSIQPLSKSTVRELQPIKKFCSNSVKLNKVYPALNSNQILKSSSCKYIAEDNKCELKKSASNIDKMTVSALSDKYSHLPYEKNSFAKVQQWQRSLVNLDKVSYGMDVCENDLSTNEDNSNNYVVHTVKTEGNLRKSRLYQKNKDVDKKNYRKSYPVGCKCDKFKDKTKEGEKIVFQMRKKLARSVSFVSYDDSMTSSLYDDADSSSDSSTVFIPKHESYKEYKQRIMQKKYEKHDRDRPVWNEIKKAKSANNVYKDSCTFKRNKRLMDNSSTSYEYSCSERKQNGKSYNKTKYRKLEDDSRVILPDYRPVIRCSSSHVCRISPGLESEVFVKNEPVIYLQHSKSMDACHRRLGQDNACLFDSKLECSCLLALENLKIQEHNSLAKFAEHVKYPRKIIDSEKQSEICRRYSSYK